MLSSKKASLETPNRAEKRKGEILFDLGEPTPCPWWTWPLVAALLALLQDKFESELELPFCLSFSYAYV